MALKKVRNVARSHRAQLLNLARNRGEDFQFLLGRWVVERFLYRLAGSSHKNSFVLKGAMLFLAWEGRLHRPTKDLDLLASAAQTPADHGIVFDLAGIAGERIKEDAEYEGVRVRVPASLGTRVSMQIDVGFGDLVDPPPADLTFPVLLALAVPVLRAFLGIANSRMKDFFDVRRLAQTRNFDMERLAGSVRGTFERRRTPLPEAVPLAPTSEFLGDHAKQTQWAAFGRRLGLRDVPTLPLIGEQIAGFLMPVLDNLNTANLTSRT